MMRRKFAIVYLALLWTVALRGALVFRTLPYSDAVYYRETFLERVTLGDWFGPPMVDDTDQVASPSAGVPW